MNKFILKKELSKILDTFSNIEQTFLSESYTSVTHVILATGFIFRQSKTLEKR